MTSALALTFTVAACSGEAPPPAPTPAPSPAPSPVATTPPPPPPVVNEPRYENFLDAPQTAGTWTYINEPGETLAIFGTSPNNPVFAVRCSAGRIELGRMTSQAMTGARVMSIKTETTTRQLQATARSGRVNVVAATLSANDSLLDAMAITKGRFAVGTEGMRTLYLPAWAEVTRVIEDCR